MCGTLALQMATSSKAFARGWTDEAAEAVQKFRTPLRERPTLQPGGVESDLISVPSNHNIAVPTVRGKIVDANGKPLVGANGKPIVDVNGKPIGEPPEIVVPTREPIIKSVGTINPNAAATAALALKATMGGHPIAGAITGIGAPSAKALVHLRNVYRAAINDRTDLPADIKARYLKVLDEIYSEGITNTKLIGVCIATLSPGALANFVKIVKRPAAIIPRGSNFNALSPEHQVLVVLALLHGIHDTLHTSYAEIEAVANRLINPCALNNHNFTPARIALAARRL